MLSRFGFTRRRDIDNSLQTLKDWAMTSWRDQWDAASDKDLQAELDDFLPTAMEHAKTLPELDRIYSARITRTILMGIAKSDTHPSTDFEAALGVPMPKEGAL